MADACSRWAIVFSVYFLIGCDNPATSVPGKLQDFPGLQFAGDVHEPALTMRSANDKMACIGANAAIADMEVKSKKTKVDPMGVKV